MDKLPPNVTNIREKVIEKNLPELSEATDQLLQAAVDILRLTGMKIAMVEGVNQTTGKTTFRVTIQTIGDSK
jgi:hypothetical protein